jgi:hypothetical protein
MLAAIIKWQGEGSLCELLLFLRRLSDVAGQTILLVGEEGILIIEAVQLFLHHRLHRCGCWESGILQYDPIPVTKTFKRRQYPV